MQMAEGTRLGRYEIRSLLGVGGMGEVYCAQDTQLHRSVALKVLPSDLTQNKDRLRRFELEAFAASALNHPNIITIYDIGQFDGTNFIATEFVDGATLRTVLERERMKLREVLDIGVQVAGALAMANEAKIIHRDIKPENIMIRKDGYVKVLDFGLAKLADQPTMTSDPEAQTMIRNVTEPGVILGTARYMSPEQARGQAIDARTDVWSLGVVLYEMIAGRTPFEGQTYSHIIVSVLEQEPPPLSAFSPAVPVELEQIIAKTLTKDLRARCQSARELHHALSQLKNKLAVDAELEFSAQPNQQTLLLPGNAAPQAMLTEQQARANTTNATQGAGSTISGKILMTELMNRKRSILGIMAVICLLLGGISYAAYKFFFSSSPTPFQTINLSRLTTTGKVTDATIAPDSKYVVYVVADAGKQSLWLKHVATSSNVQIVAPAEVQYRGLTFSPDGDFIYYVAREKANPAGTLYQVPVLGNATKTILTNIDRYITFSPDGARFAFVRRDYPKQGVSALLVANADGTQEQLIEAQGLPSEFWSPAWSPDGTTIACAAVSLTDGLHVSIFGVNVASGEVKPITTERWFDVGRIAWLGDGSGLLATVAAQGSGFSGQVWYINYPGGWTRRVTTDLNNYNGLGMAENSRALVTVQSEQRASIWKLATGAAAGAATQVTSGVNKYDAVYDLSWTPDGRIVYESTASGDEDIWIMDADGENQKQLTSKQGINLFPSVTADGRYIVFTSTRAGGNTNIWRMNADGTNPKQLTSGSIDNFPSCSGDSQWVVYMSNIAGKRTIWKVPIDGGQPVQLIANTSSRPIVSAANGLIAVYYKDAQVDSQFKVAAVPLAGGAPTKIFDIPVSSPSAVPPPLRWTPDGRALAYLETKGEVSNIWTQPLAGGAPTQLTDFKSDRIFSFDWSRDGKQLACSRGAQVSDVVLITDLKKTIAVTISDVHR